MNEQLPILLLAHGTPDVLGEMAEYLSNVTGGRALPQSVVEELQHRYAEIGLRDEPLAEGPPLTRWTLRQGQLLAAGVGVAGLCGHAQLAPFIADVVAQMRADGVTRFKAVCLAPQNSRTSVGLYRTATAKACTGMQMEFVAGWSESELLAQAFALELWPAWGRGLCDARRASACSVYRTRSSLPDDHVWHAQQSREPLGAARCAGAGGRDPELRR